MQGFHRKKGGARDLLTKEKTGLHLGEVGRGKGGEKWGGFYHADCLLLLARREERAQITLLVFDQKIPD